MKLFYFTVILAMILEVQCQGNLSDIKLVKT
jgi:hypothetical protein